MNSALSVVIFAIAAYVLIVLLMFLGQSRLIFLPNTPSRAHIATPQDVGLTYETVDIVTDDDIALSAWFVPAQNARGVLLFFHGNAGNISHRLDSLHQFHELRLSTLIFDYRGYGESEGKVSEQGTYADALAAWRYLTEQRGIAPSQIVLFGRSLGGAIATYLADNRTPAGLIIESGFTSVPDMAAQLYPWLPARQLARIEYPTADYLAGVSSPVLIAHSPDDDIIPYRHGRDLFERANEPKTFLEMRGGHNDGFLVTGPEYRNGLDTFLTSIGLH